MLSSALDCSTPKPRLQDEQHFGYCCSRDSGPVHPTDASLAYWLFWIKVPLKKSRRKNTLTLLCCPPPKLEISLPCKDILLMPAGAKVSLSPEMGNARQGSCINKLRYFFINLQPKANPPLFCQIFTNSCFFVQKIYKQLALFSSGIPYLWGLHMYKINFVFLLLTCLMSNHESSQENVEG